MSQEFDVTSASQPDGRTLHGHARDSGWTKEYRAWRSMLFRCSPKHKDASRYADRGITVCDRWRASFVDFLADMGAAPSRGHSVERINNDGNYEPNNCRWATAKEQGRNREQTIWVDGLTLKEACEQRGLKYSTVRTRLKAGHSLEAALSPRKWAGRKNTTQTGSKHD